MTILRNILAILIGAVIGSIVNMSIITLSDGMIPLPEGIVPGDMESLKANIHRFEPINFLMPFLAHAGGTFVGALLAGIIAGSQKIKLALFIGFLFFVGGVWMVMELPSPLWFNVVDLVGAYFPMAYLGGLLGMKITTAKK
jgi:hypothetical protein